MLEEPLQTLPLQSDALDTSPTAHETVSPKLEAQAGFPLEPEVSTVTHGGPEPPSPFEQTITLPSARESMQRLSPLEATTSPLGEVETAVSESGEDRDSTSSSSTDSPSVHSEVDGGLEAAEETERPQEPDEPSEADVSENMAEEKADDSSDEQSDEESEVQEEEDEVDERVARGRSMIRTSDIIEARLSRLSRLSSYPRARAEASVPAIVTEETEDETEGESEEESEAESPSENGPMSSATDAGSAEPPAEVAKAPAVLKSRPLPALLRPAQAVQSKAGSQFTQAFLMFKSLDSQNPQTSAAATSEVNHRALAGIYVPASLREQAVRNMSKSRDPGWRARGLE